jgi:UDP-N-acetylmuramate--alanine ligase
LKGHSYGFSEEAECKINHFQQLGWKVVFDLTFQGEHFSEIELPLIGAHNVLNAAATFALGLKLDIQEVTLRKAFASFPGVGRRIEKKGSVKGIEVYDDYAHHPTEIFATLRAIKLAIHCNRLIVVFQPHRYTRTRNCLEEFGEAFAHADVVIVTDIYSAREEPIPGIHPELIQEGIKKIKGVPTEYVKREFLPTFLSSYLKQGDLLLTMGAGDITQVGPLVLDELRKQ